MARYTISNTKVRRQEEREQRFRREYQGEWHEPPCYCKTNEGKQFKYRVEKEWKQAEHKLSEIPWPTLHGRIYNSKYIARRFGDCHSCVIMARKQIAMLAILLAALGIIEEEMFEKPEDE